MGDCPALGVGASVAVLASLQEAVDCCCWFGELALASYSLSSVPAPRPLHSCPLDAPLSCAAHAFGVWTEPWDSAPTWGLVEDKGLWLQKKQ